MTGRGAELLSVGAGAGVAATGRIAARLGLSERTMPLTEAVVAALERGPAAACVVLETGAGDVGGEAGALLDRALAAAARLAVEPGRGIALVFPEALLDRVAAAVAAPEAVLLCAPSDAERAAGLALAAARARVEPALGEREADRLGRLAEEVARIARLLDGLSSDAAACGGAAADHGAGAEAAVDAAFVRRLIRVRRLRDQHFDAGLFADPAWDMLLDLAAARAEGGAIAVSSLCIAAAVPPTTALRWIGTMERGGLIVRRPDPEDRRRAYLALSEGAARAMAAWLARAAAVLAG